MAKRKKPAKISGTIQKRLKRIPGKSRRFIDPQTGKTYSRRQFEKLHTRKPRANKAAIDKKYRHYLQVRDRYIKTKERHGKKISKRAAMDSDELKKVLRDLRSKDVKKKIKAIEKIMDSDRVVDWTPYIERWQKGDL